MLLRCQSALMSEERYQVTQLHCWTHITSNAGLSGPTHQYQCEVSVDCLLLVIKRMKTTLPLHLYPNKNQDTLHPDVNAGIGPESSLLSPGSVFGLHLLLREFSVSVAAKCSSVFTSSAPGSLIGYKTRQEVILSRGRPPLPVI